MTEESKVELVVLALVNGRDDTDRRVMPWFVSRSHTPAALLLTNFHTIG